MPKRTNDEIWAGFCKLQSSAGVKSKLHEMQWRENTSCEDSGTKYDRACHIVDLVSRAADRFINRRVPRATAFPK